MNSKVLLVLVMFLASVLLLSAEVAPKDVDQKFDKNDGMVDAYEVDEMKHGEYGGQWHGGYGSWRSGGPWRGYCTYGCCRRGYTGRCIRCCYHHGERSVDANTDAEEPHY